MLVTRASVAEQKKKDIPNTREVWWFATISPESGKILNEEKS